MADVFKNGHLRDDATGRLVIVFSASAVQPTRYQNGFLRDANGALVVKNRG